MDERRVVDEFPTINSKSSNGFFRCKITWTALQSASITTKSGFRIYIEVNLSEKRDKVELSPFSPYKTSEQTNKEREKRKERLKRKEGEKECERETASAHRTRTGLYDPVPPAAYRYNL